MAAPLLIVPLCLNYMGAELYGMWMAITSLTGMVLFADLGISNGLMTKLATSNGRQDARESARIVASAYLILGAVAVVLVAAVACAAWAVDWRNVLNLSDPDVAAEAPVVFLACFAAFAINIPLALIQRVQYAQHLVAQSNVWQTVGSLLSVGLVVVGVANDFPPAVVIVLAVFSAPAANLLNTIFYFKVQNPRLVPRFQRADRRTAQDLAGMGLRFFLLSVMMSVALNADTFLVSGVLGPAAAAQYSVIARMFATLSLFVTLVGLVLWPANSEALSNGDIDWVRCTTRRISAFSGAIVLTAGAPLVLFSDTLLGIWIGSTEVPPASTALLVALLAWSIILAMASPLFMVQNSVGVLGPQFIAWGVFAPVSLALKLVLAHWIGTTGVPVAAILAYMALVVPFAVFGYRKTIRQTVALCRTQATWRTVGAVAGVPTEAENPHLPVRAPSTPEQAQL